MATTKTNAANAAVTYVKGFKAVYAGKVLQLHGGTFYEVTIVEGYLKGETKVVTTAPKGGR